MSNTKTDRLFHFPKPVRKGKRSRKISKDIYDAQSSNVMWLIIHKVFNSVVHIMIGVNVFVALWFAFNEVHVSAFHLHIALCVIGVMFQRHLGVAKVNFLASYISTFVKRWQYMLYYQLLMSNAILCLNGNNVWSSYIPMHYRVRTHMILHALGSVLATAGSVVMMMEKSVNFTSTHGKLAFAALVFTGMSLINGTISLLSNGRISNIKIAKILHILCGIFTFMLSSSCLSFGYYKNSFKSWASEEFALAMTCVTCIYTISVIFKPLGIIYFKLFNLIKTKTS